MNSIDLPQECVQVGIGQWKVVPAPVGLKSILGSCVGVAIYDRVGKIGGVAHILLPNSRGSKEMPGRFADTAVPLMVEEFCRLRGPAVKSSLVARLAGGAKMFETKGGVPIGEVNHRAVLEILELLKIPVLAKDIGGEQGRNMTFDTRSGRLFVKKTGGQLYEV
ncbi:MAG: hypothetical protein RJA81_741 [Planctomycetota bacterium]|jgi:chemotaxis protein CheD